MADTKQDVLDMLRDLAELTMLEEGDPQSFREWTGEIHQSRPDHHFPGRSVGPAGEGGPRGTGQETDADPDEGQAAVFHAASLAEGRRHKRPIAIGNAPPYAVAG